MAESSVCGLSTLSGEARAIKLGFAANKLQGIEVACRKTEPLAVLFTNVPAMVCMCEDETESDVSSRVLAVGEEEISRIVE